MEHGQRGDAALKLYLGIGIVKLLSLNLWGGRQAAVLFDYLKQQAETVDVFCFQEVLSAKDLNRVHPPERGRIHLLQELKQALPDFDCFFSLTSKNHDLGGKVDFELDVGLAVFVKNNLEVGLHTSYQIFGDKDEPIHDDFMIFPKSLQHLEIKRAGVQISLFNYHGIVMPGDKLDTPDRLEQSLKILNRLKAVKGPAVLAGDFNLMPETQSVLMLEGLYRNLIKEYAIGNTRNQLSWNAFGAVQNFADYMYVSPEIKLENFSVPYMEVSDHLPMILDFSF